MSNDVTTDVLHQQWRHMHEEDTPDEMVFRPAYYGFPPSRGRTSFDLRPDGSLVEGGISPTDRPQKTEGTWRIEDNGKLFFYSGFSSEPSQVLQIASVDQDRLVIKK